MKQAAKKIMLLGLTFTALAQIYPARSVAGTVVIYPVCNHKEADGAAIGDHSNLCDAQVFGNSKMAESMYGNLIFDRNASSDDERKKYVTQLYAFIKSSARQFILKKEPKASNARINRFAYDIMTIAYHESRLTHYAYGKDKRFKLMAADIRLVSRGLMQINQTFHASRDRDNSLDIYGNISLGMDLIYDNEKYIDDSIASGKMSCISKAERASKSYNDLRLRSAWSAYNSGSEFCRFRRKDKWSKNDKEFLADMSRGEWEPLVSDKNLKSTIDVSCLANGDEFCANSTSAQAPVAAVPVAQPAPAEQVPAEQVPAELNQSASINKVLVFKDGASCSIDSTQKTICAETLRASQCLGVGSDATKINVDSDLSEALLGQQLRGAKIYSDREELCSLEVPGLIKVGQFFSLKTSVALYDDVDGKKIATLNPSGQVYQVIDYLVRGQSQFERFYKISSSHGKFGYINAGTIATYSSITQKVAQAGRGTSLFIPVAGTRLLVLPHTGIKVFSKPDTNSSVIEMLSQNTTIVAQAVQVKGSDNQVYVSVSNGKKQGFVYIGRTYLSSTLSQFVRIE